MNHNNDKKCNKDKNVTREQIITVQEEWGTQLGKENFPQGISCKRENRRYDWAEVIWNGTPYYCSLEHQDQL